MFPSHLLLSFPLLSLAVEQFTLQEQNVWTSVKLGNSLNLPDDLKGLLEQWDVVDVMKWTGHGEGLDEIRKIQVFGEDEVIT